MSSARPLGMSTVLRCNNEEAFEEVRGLIAANYIVASDGWDPLGEPTVSYEGRISRFDGGGS